MFPVPGSRVASPQAQIVFRGIPISRIAHVLVTGSHSGRHAGVLRSDSDGRGGSFLAAHAFKPGEKVTVQASLRASGALLTRFSFTVAHPAGPVPKARLALVPDKPGAVMAFRSRPDLHPPALRISRPASSPGGSGPPTRHGLIFIAPEKGPIQSGPMILDPDGSLVWFDPLPRRQVASDFRVQRYGGRPVLTWFQGYIGSGSGNGEDHIVDSSYRQIALVRAADGLRADMHEFELEPGGRALITAYFPVRWPVPDGRGSRTLSVLDGTVQEIDVKTGLLLFEWDSLDHVPLSDSYVAPSKGKPYDYFHINSAERDRDGNLIISARNTWTAYKASARTGKVLWRLGGRRPSFKMEPGTSFAFQHDVRSRAPGDRIVTLFDNGAGPPDVQGQSRGMTLRLDSRHRAASLVGAQQHSPPLLAHYEGNVEELAGGGQFLGWGQRPYFSEFSSGRIVLDGHLVTDNPSYRAYLEPWSATPATPPAVAVDATASGLVVYASWNGATDVSRWELLAGTTPRSLRVVGTEPYRGFETAIPTGAAPYVAVRALARDGSVLGVSHTIRARS